MAVAIGVDIGTTKITCLALDTEQGRVIAADTAANDAKTSSPAEEARGRSEWDALRMARKACDLLRAVAERLGARRGEVAGIGLTGQQHGVVMVDKARRPITPFVNWQDRRCLDPVPGGGQSYLERAMAIAGTDAPRRAGCALSPGFMGTTLYWMKETKALPADGKACFVTDYLGAILTETDLVTDPTNGAGSGLFLLSERDWDGETIRALGLPASLFPDVREAGDRLGALTPSAAPMVGLPEGTPVFVGLGDHQASFLGSVAYREETVFVNIGTGAQVAEYTPELRCAPPIETRPYPHSGYLLVEAGLCGGRSYALLRRFFLQAAERLFHAYPTEEGLFAAMTELAKDTPGGAGGLRCEPFFTGTRAEPQRHASWTGMSDENFTPGHMVRALLEGMARAFHDGHRRIQAVAPVARTHLVGAGNGLRENPTLAQIVADEFGLPVAVPAHREEAAFGAALVAAFGAGVFPDLAACGRLIRYRQP